VYGFNYAPLKNIALSEPLVDTVDIKAVVTDPSLVISFDLYKVKPSDLIFSAEFSAKVQRNDFIHALIAWFDIEFSACHKPIKFSTGPHSKYTHWKQTVFYLREVLTVEEGELVEGVLSNKPNDVNKRDLDIHIKYRFNANERDRSTAGECSFKMS
jgi:protein arginine N-methyltransferase 1